MQAMVEETHSGVAVQRELMSLPGFRFYPTEEELVGFYLKKSVQGGHQLNFDRIIPTLDLYRYDPWELPGLADVGERQWFFFVPRYHTKCARPNRMTVSGYWKATGSDRTVRNELLQCIGQKKTLVFYKGKHSRGQKTDWIMNEYRMPDMSSSISKKKNMDLVLCRIYIKAGTQLVKPDDIEREEPVVSEVSIEQRVSPDEVDKEGPVISGDEGKPHSILDTVSCHSNPMTDANVSSLPCLNHGIVCSSLTETKDEASIFDDLVPIIFCEEIMDLKTPKTCYPPQFDQFPMLSVDSVFEQPMGGPYSILSTPSQFQQFQIRL